MSANYNQHIPRHRSHKHAHRQQINGTYESLYKREVLQNNSLHTIENVKKLSMLTRPFLAQLAELIV